MNVSSGTLKPTIPYHTKLPQKLHCVAKIAHSVNKVKIAWRKDHNFLGRLAISFSFNLAIHCTSKNVVPSRNFNFSKIQASSVASSGVLMCRVGH